MTRRSAAPRAAHALAVAALLATTTLLRPGGAAAQQVAATEVSAEAGIHVVNVRNAPAADAPVDEGPTDVGGGLGWIDYDADGYEDLFVAVKSGPNSLWRNGGDGTFTEVDAGVAGEDDDGSNGVAVADFDGDGRPDLYVTGDVRNRLYIRDPAGTTFTDRTDEFGAGGGPTRRSTVAAAADLNLDGIVDLVVGGGFLYPGMLEACSGCPTADAALADPACAEYKARLEAHLGASVEGCPTDTCAPMALYVGTGSALIESAASLGISTRACAQGVVLAPFDTVNEWVDVYVDAAWGGAWVTEQLYNNRGIGGDGWNGYVRIAAGSVNDGVRGRGAAMADYDRDGIWDVFAAAHGDNLLYRGLTEEDFTEVAALAGVALGANLDGSSASHGGAAFMDLDLDGYEDLVVVNATGPDRVLVNQGDGTFVDHGDVIEGADDLQDERTLAFADWDRDGDLDWAVGLLRDGAAPDAAENAVLLYRNDTVSGNHFLSVTLLGNGTNSDAYGAEIQVHLGGAILRQRVYGGGSHLSQSTRTRVFGLGSATAIDRVVVDWPRLTQDEEWSGAEVSIDDPQFALLQGTGSFPGGGGDDDTADDDTADDDTTPADDDSGGPIVVDGGDPDSCSCAHRGAAPHPSAVWAVAAGVAAGVLRRKRT